MTWNNYFTDALEKKQSLTFLFRLEFKHLKFGPSNAYVIDKTNPDIQLESDSIRINGTQVRLLIVTGKQKGQTLLLL